MIRISFNHTRKPASILLIALALSSCDLMEEPQFPTWTNKLEFPLVSETVNLDDLKNEENIRVQLYSNGVDSIYAYTDTTVMDSQAVGDQLAFDDINQSFSQSVDDVTVSGSTINQASGFDPVGIDPIEEVIPSELGQIELADIAPSSTDPFLLKEIVPEAESMLGTTDSIPSGDLEPVYKPFTFSDFSQAVFAGGTLDITINNNMAIILGSPINIELMQDNGVDTTLIPGGLVNWSTQIPKGSSSTRSLDLTGMTLPGNIIIRVTGYSAGTAGQEILIDTTVINSSFTIDISGSNLLVSNATAKVPSQTIDESGNILLADSDNKIEEARIKIGSLSIGIDNQMAVASDLVINISSLEDPQGVPFSTSIPVPANQSTVDVSDIAGYSLVMTVAQQEISYSYQVKTIDTGNNFVTLSETDSIKVTITLYGSNVGEQLFFNSITGIIESQNIVETGEINVESDSKLLQADISRGSLSIDIDNRINQEGFQGLPVIVLTIPELVDANSNPLTDSLVLQPSPTANTLDFDLSNYDLVFPDTSTQVLTYETRVRTPDGEIGKYALEDSIIVDIVVSDMEFAEVTGYFSQDAMVDSNEIVLNEGTKLLEAIFESGDLTLTMTNRIGVVADVEFQIDEFQHNITAQPLTMSFRLEDVATPQDTSIDLTQYKLVFDTATPGIDQAIHYVSRVALPADQQMTLTFGDSILIDVDITGLAMASVTGIIEPDTLQIEQSEQEITMPEMVEDLQFEQVNIDIDFNSTFEIPILLTLNLSATNTDNVTEEITVTHTLTQDDDVVHINAAPLLNIHPETIVTSGQAIVGDGVSESRIAKGQVMKPVMYLNVPLSLIIEDPPFIEIDASGMDSPLPEDETVTLEEITLYAEAVNLFEFGASIVVLASNDSLAFDSLTIAAGNAPVPDTLLSFELLPLENTDPSVERQIKEIALSSDKLSILEERFFVKPEVQLLGNSDGSPSRFFTTDSLTLRTWGSLSYTIHGDQLLDEEGSK